MPLEKTNTDTVCLDTNPSASYVPLCIRKGIYRYNLWTGMYMLEPDERRPLNLFIGTLSFLGSLYAYVFVKGFVNGYAAV
mmetsp:Transcript_2227/g.3012  ORF Transcript_2227/g.3012 Transcript_2227/m.3012 type:complete len:80 (-) Transcript_2227:54-293(-)